MSEDDEGQAQLFDSEDARVLRWRIHALERMGWSEQHAVELAKAGVDYHVVQRMLDQGATPSDVLRILL